MKISARVSTKRSCTCSRDHRVVRHGDRRGGISGLSAAHYYRKALGEDQRILILDNQDDIGGHAKGNQFEHAGKTYLGFGGTMAIATPYPYSYGAKALLKELVIEINKEMSGLWSEEGSGG